MAQNVAGLQEVLLGRFVIAGFDRRLAFLVKLARVEELLALGGIGGASVARVRQLERYLPLHLDQIRRRRCGDCRRDFKDSECGNREEKSSGLSHRDGILIEATRLCQRCKATYSYVKPAVG